MKRSDSASWTSLWQSLHAQGDPAPWHRRLIAAYGETSRHYHNLQHLEECLLEFDRVRSGLERPAAVEAAIWFHDAVYNPRSSTNEEDSAALATGCLQEAGVSRDTIDRVRHLILCTKSHEPAGDHNAETLVDIDLAILGQPAPRFRHYEQAIRTEYAWVPDALFAEKRAEVLTRFLQRPALYQTEAFRSRFELTARANLEASLERLRGLAK